MPRRSTTTTEMIEIHELLKQHLERVGDQCRYVGDMDDKAIANLVAPDLPHTSVQRIRKELFGQLILPRTRRSDVRIDSLEARLNQLECKYGKLINFLDQQFSQNLNYLALKVVVDMMEED